MVFQLRRNVEKMFKGIKRLRKMLESLVNYIYELKKRFKHYWQTFFEAYESHCFPVYIIHKNMSWLFRFVSGEALSIKRNDNAEASIGSDISTISLLSKPTDAGKGDLSFLTKSDCSNFISDDLIQDCFRRGKASFQSYTLPTELNKTLTEVKDVYNLMSDEYGHGRLTPQLAVTDTNICDTNKLDTKANSIENCPEINPEKNKRKGNRKANHRVTWIVIWVVSLLSMIYQTDANPLDISSLKEYTFSALSSSTCNPRNLNMTQSCILNSDVLSIHMEYCGFTCSSDVYEPVCVNVERGMVHICAPSQRLCAKGYRWYPWLDKDNKTVHVKEEKCPKGSYQPYETDCFQACTMTHLNIKDIQEKYLVYSEGDHVSPSYVYCNYKKGYFNREHKFKLDYDKESMHEPYFCSHINNFNPCSDSLIPLPNGTCVIPCLHGECRDDHNRFICRPNCREPQLDRYSSETAGVECGGKSNTCLNGVCKRFFGSGSCQCNQGFKSDNKTKNCIDVDECREMKGLCENGKCSNIIGSYNCLCHDGYELDSSTSRCIRGGFEDKRTPYLPSWAITIIIIAIVITVCSTVAIMCVCYRFELCARILKRLRRVNKQEDNISYSGILKRLRRVNKQEDNISYSVKDVETTSESTERSDEDKAKINGNAQKDNSKIFTAVVYEPKNRDDDTRIQIQEDSNRSDVDHNHEPKNDEKKLHKHALKENDIVVHRQDISQYEEEKKEGDKNVTDKKETNEKNENCQNHQYTASRDVKIYYNCNFMQRHNAKRSTEIADDNSNSPKEAFNKSRNLKKEVRAQVEITHGNKLENENNVGIDSHDNAEFTPLLPQKAEPDLNVFNEDSTLFFNTDLKQNDKRYEIPAKKTVKKRTKYNGYRMIKNENIGYINIEDKVENVTDFLCKLCKELGIQVSKLLDGTDSDLEDTKSNETDKCNSKDILTDGASSKHDCTVVENFVGLNWVETYCEKQEPDKDKGKKDIEGSNTALGRSAGQWFSKPYNNAMTQLVINAVAEYMKSVGALMFNNEIIGTVFRAGDDYVITAFHVIQGIIDPERSGLFNFNLLERDNVYITFNASVCEPPRVKFRVRHRLSSNDFRLDYAVLQVSNRTELLPNKLKLYKNRFERLHINLLSGIGYGNPSNIFSKTLDPNCPVISSIDQKITDCQNWLTTFLSNNSIPNSVPNAVNIGYTNIDKEQNIFLDISMKHGGSGSPFLYEGLVVGMLTHGHPEFYFHLPVDMQFSFPADKRFESLLRLDFVFAHINETDPDLANEMF